MGLRHLRLAGFKTLFAGPGLKTFTCTWPQGSQRPPGKVLWAFEACVWPASKLFAGSKASKPACTFRGFYGSRRQNLRVHMATRDPQATRQGFMGLRSLRLAAFKTLFAGSRPLNLRLHMATRQGFNGPASKAFSRGYPALRPPGKVLQGFLGLRNLRLAAFKTFFAGSRRQNLRVHMATRDPQATRHGFMGPSKLAFGRLQNPFRGVPASNLRVHMATRDPQATRQGFMGLRSLRLAAFKTLFAGSRPLNLRLHMATRQGFNGPASKAFSRGYPALRPPGKVLQGFMGLRSLRLAGLQNLFAGSRRQNLRVHMATRDPQATRQGFMGLRSLRLAAFKTLFAGSRPLTFACTWLQGTYKGPSGHQARFYGPSKLAFGRLQNPFRGVPASKPSPPHGHQARF